MSFPYNRGILCLGKFFSLKRQRPVPAPAVRPDDMHTAVKNPERCLPAKPATFHKVFGCTPVRRCSALREKYIPRAERMTNFIEFCFYVLDRDVVPIGKIGKVKFHTAAHTPLQRELIDSQGRLPLILCGVKVPGCVHMSACMRRDLQDLDRPAEPARQIAGG